MISIQAHEDVGLIGNVLCQVYNLDGIKCVEIVKLRMGLNLGLLYIYYLIWVFRTFSSYIRVYKMSDSDDDKPQLSAEALAALQEFYTEQQSKDENDHTEDWVS